MLSIIKKFLLLILDVADHKNISFKKNTSKNTKNINEIKKLYCTENWKMYWISFCPRISQFFNTKKLKFIEIKEKNSIFLTDRREFFSQI